MRARTTVIALLTAFAGLTAAAAPGAALPSRAAAGSSGNLIRNGSAEQTSPAPSSDGSAKVALAHWKVAKKKDQFTAVTYGTPEFMSASDPGPAGRGKNFFTGGATGHHSVASQAISLSGYAAWVKSGAEFALSGWLGGFESQRDHAVVKVVWLDRHGNPVGAAHIGPVTASDRDSQTELLARSATGSVPKHAATARVVVTMTRFDGTYVDGYADKLSLVLRKS